MALQHVDFYEAGLVNDTGENASDAIRPVVDGENAAEAVFQRPSENLRKRTEIIRNRLEDLAYLDDADRAMMLTGAGNVTWNGVQTSGFPTKGNFTISSDLIIRPFLSTITSTPAKVTQNNVKFSTITATVGSIDPPRAYSGANKITIKVTGASGGPLSVTIDGEPVDNVHITVNTHATTGTTRQQLVDYLTAHIDALAFRNLGLTASVVTGGSTVFLTDPTGFQVTLSGAVDAEKHIITSGGLSAFFSVTDSSQTVGTQDYYPNRMREGDTLCIWYDTLIDETYGGRRQSLTDLPEDSANVDANLFLLRNNPERLSLAIPVATAQGGKLLFSNNILLADGASAPIDGSVIQAASLVTYAGGPAWKDGTTNPATDVESQLDKIVTDLVGALGAKKIGVSTAPLWHNGDQNLSTNLKDRVDAIVNDLASDTDDESGADRVGCSDRSNWRDTTSNPATSVHDAIDKIIVDLSANSGAVKVGYAGGSTWADASTNPATSVEGQLDKIITDLAATSGAAKIGAAASGSLSSTTVQAQLYELRDEKVRLTGNETIAGNKTLSGTTTFTGPVVDGTWTNFFFAPPSTEWDNAPGFYPARYRLGKNGMVTLRGVVNFAYNNPRDYVDFPEQLVITNLPVGARPSFTLNYWVFAQGWPNGMCWVQIKSNGDIVLEQSTVFDAISYPTADRIDLSSIPSFFV
jgi:hypothetical protein